MAESIGRSGGRMTGRGGQVRLTPSLPPAVGAGGRGTFLVALRGRGRGYPRNDAGTPSGPNTSSGWETASHGSSNAHIRGACLAASEGEPGPGLTEPKTRSQLAVSGDVSAWTGASVDV